MTLPLFLAPSWGMVPLLWALAKFTLLELATGEGLLEPGIYGLRITSPDLPLDQYQQRIVD